MSSEKQLISLARRKKWEELAAAINEHPQLVCMHETAVKEVRYFGDWNSLTGIYALVADNPKGLKAALKKEPALKYVAPVGFGMGIGRLHHHAAHKENDALKILLDLGFEANDISANTPGSQKMFIGGSTPIYGALVNKNIANAQLLVEYGADVSHQDRDGEHALHVTAAKGHFEETKWILEQGVSPNMQDVYGMTPLHSAARRASSPKTLELLIDGGGDISIKNNEGKTPLDLAREHKKKKSIAFLEKY